MDTTSMIHRTLVVEQGVQPPDGGWGWVVVLAGFVCHVVVDGIIYSSGVFFDEFLSYFGEGHALTSWIASILMGSYFISSPIASGLTIRYGCRTTVITGSLLSAVGLFLSIYAPNILYLYFSFGLVAGTGFGLILLPAVVCVSTYFNRRRSLATGVTVCGSGVGTFVLAPLVQLLIRLYGWKGTLIVCSGLSLQGVVAGLLMRPVQPASPLASQEPSSSYEPAERSSTLSRHLAVYELPVRTPSTDAGVQLQMVGEGAESFHTHVRLRKDLFYAGSLPEEQRQPVMSFFATDSTLLDSPDHSHVITLVDNRNLLCRTLFSYQMTAAFYEMLDFRLFGDRVFLAFALSRFLCGLGYSVPYLFLSSMAVELLAVTAAEGSFLVSLIGLSNVLGRVLVGVASDSVGRGRLWLYMACVVTCGLSTVLCVMCTSYSCLIVYTAVYGAASGGFITLSSIVVVDLVGLNNLTNAYGLSLLCIGVAALVGPPLNGLIHDVFESYMPGFLLAGVSLYVGGVTLLAVPYLQSGRRRRGRHVIFHSNA
ncbi:monocarboxylate transporter 10-like [Ixodes scapularis]